MNDTTASVGSVRRHRGKRAALLGLAVASLVGVLVVEPMAAHASPAATRAPVIRNDPLALVAAAALVDLYSMQESRSIAMREPTTVDLAQRYVATRNALATAIAERVEIEPARMIEAWAKADQQHQVALLAALSQLGVSYRRNTSKPGIGFDCSGLTAYAWGVAGVALAHQSRRQINATAARTLATTQAGDLVYYPGHISMYLGVDNAIVHSPNTGRTVEVSHVRKGRKLRFSNPAG